MGQCRELDDGLYRSFLTAWPYKKYLVFFFSPNFQWPQNEFIGLPLYLLGCTVSFFTG